TLLLAKRWKPSNRLRLRASEPVYEVGFRTGWTDPVAELNRLVDPSLDDPPAVIVGRNAPVAERSLALAVRWFPRAWTTAGCTSSARRTASASETWSCAGPAGDACCAASP